MMSLFIIIIFILCYHVFSLTKTDESKINYFIFIIISYYRANMKLARWNLTSYKIKFKPIYLTLFICVATVLAMRNSQIHPTKHAVHGEPVCSSSSSSLLPPPQNRSQIPSPVYLQPQFLFHIILHGTSPFLQAICCLLPPVLLPRPLVSLRDQAHPHRVGLEASHPLRAIWLFSRRPCRRLRPWRLVEAASPSEGLQRGPFHDGLLPRPRYALPPSRQRVGARRPLLPPLQPLRDVRSQVQGPRDRRQPQPVGRHRGSRRVQPPVRQLQRRRRDHHGRADRDVQHGRQHQGLPTGGEEATAEDVLHVLRGLPGVPTGMGCRLHQGAGNGGQDPRRDGGVATVQGSQAALRRRGLVVREEDGDAAWLGRRLLRVWVLQGGVAFHGDRPHRHRVVLLEAILAGLSPYTHPIHAYKDWNG